MTFPLLCALQKKISLLSIVLRWQQKSQAQISIPVQRKLKLFALIDNTKGKEMNVTLKTSDSDNRIHKDDKLYLVMPAITV